ncbi:MAG: hypothetical protein K6F99_03895 [Lachnospiraceae bacterium]|nr:hypothetical protein [Lachnospiraceae bacterium]
MATFLLILKIIGIVLLSILGLVLLILCMILFLPFHYRIDALFDSEQEKYEGTAKVTYLFHTLNARAEASKENGVSYFVKVLGRTIMSSEDEEDEDDEEWDEEPKPAAGDRKKTKTTPPENDASLDEFLKEEMEKPEIKWEEPGYAGEYKELWEEEDKADLIPTPEEKKQTLGDKIRSLTEAVKRTFNKVITSFKNIGYTIKDVCDKIKRAFNRIDYYRALLSLESSKKAIEVILREVKRLLWAIRARKLKCYLNIGRPDPADTGELIGKLYALSPIIGKYLVLEPDFDREVMNGTFLMKGYLQLYIVLICICKLYFNKKVMRFYRRLKHGTDK